MWSHSQPIIMRTTMVMATEAMTELPIWALVRWSSSRMIGIKGAMPNHPKKHRKNAIQLMWNARMGALVKSARRMLVALVRTVMSQFSLVESVNTGSYGETTFFDGDS